MEKRKFQEYVEREAEKKKPLKEILKDYLLNHYMDLSRDMDECEAQIAHGLEAFFKASGEEYLAPKVLLSNNFTRVADNIIGSGGALRLILLETMNQAFDNLPFDNSQCKRTIEKVIGNYKVHNPKR